MPATLTGSIRVSALYRAGDGMFRVKLSKSEAPGKAALPAKQSPSRPWR